MLLLLDLGKRKELVQMSKPARLYPKPDPVIINPEVRKGRLYRLTETGEEVVKNLNE